MTGETHERERKEDCAIYQNDKANVWSHARILIWIVFFIKKTLLVSSPSCMYLSNARSSLSALMLTSSSTTMTISRNDDDDEEEEEVKLHFSITVNLLTWMKSFKLFTHPFAYTLGRLIKSSIQFWVDSVSRFDQDISKCLTISKRNIGELKSDDLQEEYKHVCCMWTRRVDKTKTIVNKKISFFWTIKRFIWSYKDCLSEQHK